MGESWPLFIFLAGLIAAWSVILLGVTKSMMSSGFRSQETAQAERSNILAAKIEELKKMSEKIQGFERQILELKADLPLNYVRKEDFIRHEVVINTKLDRLRDLLEDMKERNHAR